MALQVTPSRTFTDHAESPGRLAHFQIVDCDPELEEWCVIYFGKTPLTDAGVDVYVRQRDALSPARLEAIMASAYDKDPSLEALVKGAALEATKQSA